MFQRCRRNWRQFIYVKYDPLSIAKVNETQNNQFDLKLVCSCFLFVLVPPFLVYLPLSLTSLLSLQLYLPSTYFIIVPEHILKAEERQNDQLMISGASFSEFLFLIIPHYLCFFMDWHSVIIGGTDTCSFKSSESFWYKLVKCFLNTTLFLYNTICLSIPIFLGIFYNI